MKCPNRFGKEPDRTSNNKKWNRETKNLNGWTCRLKTTEKRISNWKKYQKKLLEYVTEETKPGTRNH